MGATQPTESWQFFTESLDALGLPTMQRIFGNVSTTSIYRWARKPGETVDWQAGPLLHLAALLRLLTEHGRQDLAEAGLRLVAEPCGAQVSFAEAHARQEAMPPQSAAANLVEAVAELQRAARTGTDAKVVDALADVLMARALELTQSVRVTQASGARPRWNRGAAAEPMPRPTLLQRIFRRRG